MRSFKESKDDASKDIVTNVRVFPDGTVLADGIKKRGQIQIQQAMQLLVLAQQADQEVLIGTKSCPAIKGYRCRSSAVGGKSKFMQHLSKGGFGTIVSVAEDGQTCSVKWDKTGTIHAHKTGFVLPRANIGMTFERLTLHVWQLIRLDAPVGPRSVPLYTPPKLGDRLIAVDGTPLAEVKGNPADAFRGVVGTAVTLTFTDDWGRWDITVERKPLDDDDDQAAEVHPEAEYELALGAKELPDGSGEAGLLPTSWEEFNRDGLQMHGAHVRIKRRNMEVLGPMKPRELAALGLGFDSVALRSFFTADVVEEGDEEEQEEQEVVWDDFIAKMMADKPQDKDNSWVMDKLSALKDKAVEALGQTAFWEDVTNALSPQHIQDEARAAKKQISGDRTKQIQKYVADLGISKELYWKISGRTQREQVKMLEMIRDLREELKADASKARMQEMSALHQAVLRDDVDTAVRLMEQGVPAETPSPQGDNLTALQTAVKCGNLRMVEAMVTLGKAKVNFAVGGSWPLEVQLRRLFARRLKVERGIAKLQQEAELQAEAGRSSKTTQEKRADLVRDKILLDEEIKQQLEAKIALEASQLDVNSRSPLALACMCKNPGMVQLLLDLGAETEVGLPVAAAVLKGKVLRRGAPQAETEVDTLHDWCKRSFPLGMLIIDRKIELKPFMRQPLFAVFLNWSAISFEHHQDPASPTRPNSVGNSVLMARAHKAQMLYRISGSKNELYSQVQSNPYVITFPQLRHGVDAMKFQDEVWTGHQELEHFVKLEEAAHHRRHQHHHQQQQQHHQHQHAEGGRHVSHRILRTLFMASRDREKREEWKDPASPHHHFHDHVDHSIELGYEEFKWIVHTLCDAVFFLPVREFALIAMSKLEVAGMGDVAWSEASSEVSAESRVEVLSATDGASTKEGTKADKLEDWKQGETNLRLVAKFVDNPNLLQALLGSWVELETKASGEPGNHLGERAHLKTRDVREVQFRQELAAMHTQEVARQCGPGQHVWDATATHAVAADPLHSALLQHQHNLRRGPKGPDVFDATLDGKEQRRFHRDVNEKRFMRQTAQEKKEEEVLAPVETVHGLVDKWRHRWLTVAKPDPRTGDPYKYGGEDGQTQEPYVDYSKRPPTLNVFNNLATVTATDQNHAIHSFFG